MIKHLGHHMTCHSGYRAWEKQAIVFRFRAWGFGGYSLGLWALSFAVCNLALPIPSATLDFES